MKLKQTPFKIFLILLVTTILYSCSRKEVIPPSKNGTTKINNFIWKGMNAYYKWQSDVPDLADKRFTTRTELNSYLAGFEDPANLFETLRNKPGVVDRFSWIVDDYVALEKSFQGIRTTSGIKMALKLYEDGSDNVYAYVRDVIENSDAASKGVTRGMVFNEINGQQLNKGNYKTLFDNDAFTITIADSFNGGNPVAGTSTIDLTKTAIQENPVKIAKVIEQGGKKIGYLLYNQFSSPYDSQLNAAFSNFKSQGVTDLILDLRYNGGGSVRSAIYLASMITGQFDNEVYSKQIWNEKVMANVDNSRFISKFTDKINNNGVNETINSIGMTSVYIIVSGNTASASELIINGLKPYIDVKLVGSTTVGKQVGSITLYDSDNFGKDGKNFDTSHNWAMQPIVIEITNKNGENNPNGYTPEIEINEDPANLGALGDVTEPLLARTLQYMLTGARGFSNTNTSKATETLWDSDMENIDYQNMYFDIK